MTNLKLKQINITLNISNSDCNHSDIKTGTNYLVIIDGSMHIGTFSKQWYGWNFGPWLNGIGVQLNGLDSVYEILNSEDLENYGIYPSPPVSEDYDYDAHDNF